MLEAINANCKPNVITRVADASELYNLVAFGPDASFTYALTTFMFVFSLEPANVWHEMHRVLSQRVSLLWRFGESD